MVETIPATRVVSTPTAIDAATVPSTAVALRLAPDELLVLGAGPVTVDDEHAIIVADFGWSGTWLEAMVAAEFLRHSCEWDLPQERPAFAQGMVAHLAVKVWFEPERTLILLPSPLAAELQERLDAAL